MQIFKKNTNYKSIYLLKSIPISINFFDGRKSVATFLDGSQLNLGCLNCRTKNCLYFDRKDIEVSDIKDFAIDLNYSVCPVSAIFVDNNDGMLHFYYDKCIKCGLCAKRCPVGAIYFKSGYPIVNYDTTNYLIMDYNEENLLKQQNQINLLSSAIKTGKMIQESDELFKTIYGKLFNLNNKYHDLLGRNLLIGLSCTSGKRRIGDVYTRMDAIYHSIDNSLGSVEIEFGRDTLDASRAILDDIAVLNVRYNLKKEKNNSIVICLQLPNARQGYWQVIKDIKIVEKLQIQTISIGALYLLIWNNCVLKLGDRKYYIDFDNMSLRKTIESELGHRINITNKLLGILEPIK